MVAIKRRVIRLIFIHREEEDEDEEDYDYDYDCDDDELIQIIQPLCMGATATAFWQRFGLTMGQENPADAYSVVNVD